MTCKHLSLCRRGARLAPEVAARIPGNTRNTGISRMQLKAWTHLKNVGILRTLLVSLCSPTLIFLALASLASSAGVPNILKHERSSSLYGGS